MHIEDINILEMHINVLKNDFSGQNVDLHVAKIEAETIIKQLSKLNQEELKVKELLKEIKKLLNNILHEISIQEKEQFFNSSNNF